MLCGLGRMYAGGGEFTENINDGELIKMKHMTMNGIGGKVHY